MLAEKRGRAVALDFAQVSQMGTQFMQVLVTANWTWNDGCVPFEIKNKSDNVRNGLQICGLNPSQVGPKGSRMTLKVLAIADSRTMRDLLHVSLTEYGFEITLAEDGIDGPNKLEAADPDVAITDINMPRLDGFGVIEAVPARTDHRATPTRQKGGRSRQGHHPSACRVNHTRGPVPHRLHDQPCRRAGD